MPDYEYDYHGTDSEAEEGETEAHRVRRVKKAKKTKEDDARRVEKKRIREEKLAASQAKRDAKTAKKADKERINAEKVAEKLANPSARRTRATLIAARSPEQRKAAAKEYYESKKDKYNRARMMSRHANGESIDFNRKSTIKYNLKIDGKPVREFDEDAISSAQMRGIRVPIFENRPNPPAFRMERGEKLSYVKLMDWMEQDSENSRSHINNTKNMFQLIRPVTYGEIEDVYPILNDHKLVFDTLQANVESNGRRWEWSTLKNYFANCLWLTSHPPLIAATYISTAAKAAYTDINRQDGWLALKVEAIAQAKTTDEAHRVYSWQTIIKRMKLRYEGVGVPPNRSPYMLYLRLYEDMASRNDLGYLEIVEDSDDCVKGRNYLVKHDPSRNNELLPYVFLTDFKNDRIIGESRSDLSIENQRIVLDVIKDGRKYLFCKPGTLNQPWGKSITQSLNAAFKEAGLNMVSTELRNSYLTYMLPKMTTIQQRVALGNKFRHNIKTQAKYVRVEQSAITEQTDDAMLRWLENPNDKLTGAEVVSRVRAATAAARPTPETQGADEGSYNGEDYDEEMHHRRAAAARPASNISIPKPRGRPRKTAAVPPSRPVVIPPSRPVVRPVVIPPSRPVVIPPSRPVVIPPSRPVTQDEPRSARGRPLRKAGNWWVQTPAPVPKPRGRPKNVITQKEHDEALNSGIKFYYKPGGEKIKWFLRDAGQPYVIHKEGEGPMTVNPPGTAPKKLDRRLWEAKHWDVHNGVWGWI